MAANVRRVFISATSRDLGTYRRVVRDALTTAELEPAVQDNFPPDYRTISEMLREKIRRCDAVICLVGDYYGAAPPQTGETPRSYTQLEYFVARELGKPIFLFMAQPDCPRDEHDPEPEELQQLQRDYRERLEADTHVWAPFSSAEELRRRVAELLLSLPRTATSERLLDLHPAGSIPYFAGRTEELRQLSQSAGDLTPSAIVVVGVGGQGKTTLVSHWLAGEDRPQFDAVFRCTAYRGGYTFDQFLDDALGFLEGETFQKRDAPTVFARSRRLIEQFQRQSTLLIIDGIERWLSGWNAGRGDLPDAESAEDRGGFFEGLDDFLADAAGLTNGSHLILTTRALPSVLDDAAAAVVPVGEDGRPVPLQGLDNADATALLRRLGVKGEDEEILRVAKSYRNHPLALTVLGRLLHKRFGGRLEKLSRVSAFDARDRLFQLLGETHASLPRREETERLLQVAGHCLENPPVAAVAAGMSNTEPDEDELWRLMDLAVLLADWNLLEWDGEAEVMALHPLIKEYFAKQASDSREIHERLSNWYSNQSVPDDAGTMEEAKGRFLAIEHALRTNDRARCAELIFALFVHEYVFVDWLAVWGHFATGEQLLARVAEGAGNVERGELLVPRAAMLRQLSRLDTALACIDEAIELLDSPGEAESLDQRLMLAAAWTNRGNVEREARQYQNAVNDYDRALEITRLLGSFLPSARLATARTLANRGNAWDELGQLSRALDDYAEAIEVFELFDDESLLPQSINVQLSRANVLGESHRHVEAVQAFDQVIAAYRRQLDGGREEYRSQWAQAHSMRGFALCQTGRDADSLRDLDLAVSELSELVESHRRDQETNLALAYMNRAHVHLTFSRYSDAERDCQLAVSGFRRLVESGNDYARGWLAHSHLSLGEAKLHIEGLEAGMASINTGRTIFRELIAADPLADRVYLRKLLHLTCACQVFSAATARELLIEGIDLADSIQAEAEAREALYVELGHGLEETAAVEDDLELPDDVVLRLRSLRAVISDRYNR